MKERKRKTLAVSAMSHIVAANVFVPAKKDPGESLNGETASLVLQRLCITTCLVLPVAGKMGHRKGELVVICIYTYEHADISTWMKPWCLLELPTLSQARLEMNLHIFSVRISSFGKIGLEIHKINSFPKLHSLPCFLPLKPGESHL